MTKRLVGVLSVIVSLLPAQDAGEVRESAGSILEAAKALAARRRAVDLAEEKGRDGGSGVAADAAAEARLCFDRARQAYRAVSQWADVLRFDCSPELCSDPAYREAVHRAGFPWRVSHRVSGMVLHFLPGEDPIYVCERELSRRAARSVLGDDAITAYGDFGPDDPVTKLSLTELKTVAEGLGMRFPTEIEWRRLASGGSEGRYPWGADPSGGEGYVNCFDQEEMANPKIRQIFGGAGWPRTAFPFRDPTIMGVAPSDAAYRRNGYGLLHVIGNLREVVMTNRGTCALRGGSYCDGLEIANLDRVLRWDHVDEVRAGARLVRDVEEVSVR